MVRFHLSVCLSPSIISVTYYFIAIDMKATETHNSGSDNQKRFKIIVIFILRIQNLYSEFSLKRVGKSGGLKFQSEITIPRGIQIGIIDIDCIWQNVEKNTYL